MAADEAGTPSDQGVPAEAPVEHDDEAEGSIPDLSALEAATAETEDANHRVEFRVGDDEPLAVQLPPECPASVALRLATIEDDDGRRSLKLLDTMLSAEQYDAVMRRIDAGGYKLRSTPDGGFEIDDEVLTGIGNLFNDALRAYGLTAGESTASPES